jgi:hypothetical protein
MLRQGSRVTILAGRYKGLKATILEVPKGKMRSFKLRTVAGMVKNESGRRVFKPSKKIQAATWLVEKA